MQILKALVYAFDCEDGQDESIYLHATRLIEAMMGHDAERVFSHYIDATDNRFYLKEGFKVACWRDMCDAAANQLLPS